MSEDSKPSKDKNGNGNGKSQKTQTEEFKQLISKKGDIRVAVFSHAFPDPDAIGSMMGVSWLLQRAFNLESDLFYQGEVSHPQNGTMCNLLDPGIRRADDPNEGYKPDNYGLTILVDTIPSNAGTGSNKVKFDVVIDHHKDLPHDFEGLLIHKKVGSCAAIVYDLIKLFVKEEQWFEVDVDTDTKVATALIAGIVTDTEYMMADDSTEYEFRAFSELFHFRDPEALKQIVFFKRPKFWVDRKAVGCGEAKIDSEGYAIVGLGMIPEKQRDLIADMAEEMVSWASVETAIAFGVVGGDRIEGSVRSLNASVSVSELCKKLGGKHGQGGGKHGKGAYRTALACMSLDADEDEETVRETWACINKKETKRIGRLLKK